MGRFQAGAAGQGAVDVGARHQFPRVRGFYRAAIENTDPGSLLVKSRGEEFPDKLMNLLDIFSRRGQAGADRPNRLIGHHQIVGPRPVRPRAVELPPPAVEDATPTSLALPSPDTPPPRDTSHTDP